VTVVRDVKGAKRALEALYAHQEAFFAVDTEVGREGGREGGRGLPTHDFGRNGQRGGQRSRWSLNGPLF
jgi:hypothetical protein